MPPEHIAAYIGAAAWLPQIVSWIYRWLLRSRVVISSSRVAHVGFSSYGPVFNVGLSLSAENKDALLDEVEVLLTHEDGEMHRLRWFQLSEVFSHITDSSSGKVSTVGRRQSPIAVKVPTDSLFEKLFHFHDPLFQENQLPLEEALLSYLTFLRASKPVGYEADLGTSRQLFDLLESKRGCFWWKQGGYRLEFVVRSPDTIQYRGPSFAFSLSADDVAKLRGNLALVDQDTLAGIASHITGEQRPELPWAWVTVRFTLVD